MQLRIGVILNQSAGVKQELGLHARLRDLLGANGSYVEIHSASSDRSLHLAAAQCLENGCNVLVAGGGDGTVSRLAGLLIDSPVALAVLPLGTLNHFARDLGIPTALEGAAGVILTGQPAAVDVGEVNGRYFINNSSLGLYPSIVRRREKWERTGFTRMLAFAAAILFVFRRYPFLDVSLRVGETELLRRTPFIFVGNNQYEVEGLRVGQRTKLNGGSLALYMANRTGRWGLLRIAISALFRRLRRNRDFEVLLAQELSIAARRKRVAVALDGEVVRMKPPLRFSIRPGALRVIVPA